MQCVNCQFENMPGLTKCVRCGGSLTLASANIDVIPPRAGRWTKRMRQAGFRSRVLSTPLRWFWTMIERLSTAVGVALEPISFDVPIYTALIPGWPQYILGRRPLAIVHLASYVFFMGLTLPFLGSWLSSLSLALAFGSHFSSVFSVLLISRSDDRSRLTCGIIMVAVVAVFVCLPMYRLVDWFGWPMELLQPMAGFRRGDVLLLQRNVTRDGDVVIYQPASQLPNLILRGPWVGRVLGEGPVRLEWKQSVLHRDGQPFSWQPPQGGVPPQDQVIDVPPGILMILQPSPEEVIARNRRLPFVGPGVPVLQLQQRIALVPRSQIMGRVCWQTWPLAQWGAVE